VAALDFAEAHHAVAALQHRAGLAAAERALARYRRLGDKRGIVEAQRVAGWALIFLGRVEDGEALLQIALDAARGLGLQLTAGVILSGLAYARPLAGDLVGARARNSEALALAQAAGFESLAANLSLNRAELEFASGDALTALRLAGEALPIFRAFRYTLSITGLLSNSAAYFIALRRYDEARTAARESLTLARDLQLEVRLAFDLQHLSAIAGLRAWEDAAQTHEQRSRAARLLGYAGARLVVLDATREYTEQQEYDSLLPALRDALGDHELQKLLADGSTWSEDRAVAEALLV
jgi:tetratricopeptide (TPR) repeat protein